MRLDAEFGSQLTILLSPKYGMPLHASKLNLPKNFVCFWSIAKYLFHFSYLYNIHIYNNKNTYKNVKTRPHQAVSPLGSSEGWQQILLKQALSWRHRAFCLVRINIHIYTFLFFFVLSERAYKQKIPKYITEKVGVILQVMFCFIYSLLKIAIALRIIRYNIVGRRVQLAFMFGGHM